MHIFFHYNLIPIRLLCCVLLVLPFLTSCSLLTKPTSLPQPITNGSLNEIQPRYPDPLKIAIYVDDYLIKNYRLISDISPMQGIKMSGRYKEGDTLYFRFDPVPQSHHPVYWLAEVPPIKSGNDELEARLIRSRIDIGYAIPDPPKEIRLNVIISNRKVSSVRIDNYSSSTVGLYYSKKESYKSSDGKVGVIRSNIYTNTKWLFLFPKTNGSFILLARPG